MTLQMLTPKRSTSSASNDMVRKAGGGDNQPVIFIRTALVVCLLALVCFVLPLEWLGTKVENESRYKRRYLENHADDIATLLLGHSLFAVSFNPHVLGDSVFMTSQVNRKLWYDVELARRYLPMLPNLHTVLYPINIGYLAADGRSITEGAEYARSWHLYCDGFPQRWLCRSLLASGHLSYRSFHSGVGCDSLGYTAHTNRKDGLRPTVSSTQHEPEVVDRYARLLAELAGLCHDRGVRFIAVVCPASDSYLGQCTDRLHADLQHVVATVQAQQPMEFRNYLDDIDFRCDTLYYDDLHLNHSGATRFAQRVKEDFGL